MKKQMNGSISKQKVIAVTILYATTIIIMFLGVYFSIFSAVNRISLKVLNADIPGFIFGLLVLYLGLRYYLMVDKMKPEVYKESSKFSWSNFKKNKSQKK